MCIRDRLYTVSIVNQKDSLEVAPTTLATFSFRDCTLRPMKLTVESKLYSVKMEQHAKYHLVQTLLSDTKKDTHTHTHSGPTGSTEPLKWSVTTPCRIIAAVGSLRAASQAFITFKCKPIVTTGPCKLDWVYYSRQFSRRLQLLILKVMYVARCRFYSTMITAEDCICCCCCCCCCGCFKMPPESCSLLPFILHNKISIRNCICISWNRYERE